MDWVDPEMIGFYAPLKPPNHETPSGDRRMARLIMAALEHAGYDVQVMSQLRALDKAGDTDVQRAIAAAAQQEAARILATRPAIRAWVTYHVYYKAPDWIGPHVARALDIPYIVLEPSYAPSRAQGPWALTDDAVRASFDQAALLGTLTRHDQVALQENWAQKVRFLPPFLGARDFPASASPLGTTPPTLVAIGMLRPGDKQRSYTVLAEWLQQIQPVPWTLQIVGDGAARASVEQAFAPFGDRVQFLGQLSQPRLAQVLAQATAIVWPAVNEAYGMALLEAQAAGVPVVACRVRGVPDVVCADGAFLVPEGDGVAFACAVQSLLEDRPLAYRMGQAARDWVQKTRTLTQAAQLLKTWIEGCVHDVSRQ